MDAFRDAWLAVDTSAAGKIPAAKLAAHMRRQGYEDAFVNKWMRVFDADANGNLDIASFCEVLGFDADKIMKEAKVRAAQRPAEEKAEADERQQQQQQQQPLRDQVEYISGDMDDSWQEKMVEICMEGLRANEQLKEAPKWIKQQLDRQFGQLWHVVIVNGQFWCYYGHEPGMSYAFKLGSRVFIVYKSPAS